MRSKILILSLIIWLSPLFSSFSDEKKSTDYADNLPPMETFILEPVEIENESIWVPAAKVGPVINRSCRIKEDSSSCVLPATVNHSKKDNCPDDIARILAEQIAYYHEKALPLTIFNGWQWEYLYSLSQYESKTYDLGDHGGSWENTWEVILTSSIGHLQAQWIPISILSNDKAKADENVQSTKIEINTFSDMRTRDGYPKIRKIE